MYIKKSAALSSYAKQKLLTEFVIVPRRGLELYEFSIRNWTDSPFARIVSQSGFKSSRKVPRTLLPGYTKIPFRGFLLCDYTTKLALISNLEANSQRAERVVIRYLHVRIGVRGGATSPYRSGTPCQYFSSVKILVLVVSSASSTAHRFNPYGLIIL